MTACVARLGNIVVDTAIGWRVPAIPEELIGNARVITA
jgi:hypothetical protein